MNDVVSLRLIKSVRGTLMLCLTLATPVLAHAQSMPLPHVSPHSAQTVPMSASLVPAAIAHSPLSFEANMGQTDKNVRFMARGTGYSLFLTPTNAVFDFQEPTVRTGGASKVLRTRPSVSHLRGLLRISRCRAGIKSLRSPITMETDIRIWFCRIPVPGHCFTSS